MDSGFLFCFVINCIANKLLVLVPFFTILLEQGYLINILYKSYSVYLDY